MNSGNKMIWTIILLVLAVGTMTVATFGWLNTRKMCKALGCTKNAKTAPAEDVDPEEEVTE